MLSLDTLLSFLAVAAVITLAPGPDNLMVLSQSLARGRLAGFGFALGNTLGCFTHTLWAALGVSAAVATSPLLFLALKLTGAAYLGWLGLQALRHAAATRLVAVSERQAEPWRHYLQRGFIANAINPKVALFFIALLPQFVDPDRGHATLQMVQLGIVFALQTIVLFGAIAFAAGSIGRLLSRRPVTGLWLDRVAGLIFVALALRLAFDGPPSEPS